jgi:hypothetical protein
MILIYIYKGIVPPYAGSYLGLDITFYVVWGLTSVFRHLVGINGLARCEPIALIFFVVISLFCVVACNLYFVRFQTYILRIERLLSSFCMALEGLEAVLALVCAIMYMTKGPA